MPAARINATNGAVPRRDRASNRITTTAGLGPESVNGELSRKAPPAAQAAVAASDRCRNLGRALKSNGQFTEAKTAWRQALDILTKLVAIYPDNSDLQQRWCDCGNDLAWLLLSHPDPDSDDPALALTLASQVVERFSASSVYWNTLGVAFFRTGNFESAVTALDRAIALSSGGTAFDHVFLAMSHARLGNLEVSQECLARAMFDKEKGHPSHTELARLCDEAQSIIAFDPDAPAIAQ